VGRGRIATVAAGVGVTGIVALPIGGLAGATLAAWLDPDVCDGLGLEVSDGLTSTVLASAIFAPALFALGWLVMSLAGARSRRAKLGVPALLVTALAIASAYLVSAIAPSPAPVERANAPVLALVSPAPGARSGELGTFNASGEWESRDWVTRRVDTLAAGTTRSAALRHYRAALSTDGWRVEGAASVALWAHRPGHRLVVRIDDEARQVELDLR
jgi:hypothetical protein